MTVTFDRSMPGPVFVWIWFHIFCMSNIAGESTEKAVCNFNQNTNVICIGFGTYGKSLCHQAMLHNLSVIAVFDTAASSLSQSVSEVLHMENSATSCDVGDIYISNMDDLPGMLSNYKHDGSDSDKLTALIAMTSALESWQSIVSIAELCLSHSVNVIATMTPQLSSHPLVATDSTVLSELQRLHALALKNNAYFHARGLAHFLRGVFPFEAMTSLRGKYREVVGRISCNADYIGYIHRHEKPNVFNDWYIGQRVEDYHRDAATLHFYKLLQTELETFTHSLLSAGHERTDTLDEWLYSFSSKAIYDRQGETISLFLNRQIDSGRVTAIRFNGRLMRVDDHDNEHAFHIIVRMGVPRGENDRALLTPCHIEWLFLDEHNEELYKTEIHHIDIVAAMMYDAVQQVIEYQSERKRTFDCGVCCDYDHGHETENECLLKMQTTP